MWLMMFTPRWLLEYKHVNHVLSLRLWCGACITTCPPLELRAVPAQWPKRHDITDSSETMTYKATYNALRIITPHRRDYLGTQFATGTGRAVSVQRLAYGLIVRGILVWLPAGRRDSALLQCTYNGSYSVGNGGSVSGNKAAEAWSWPVILI